MNTLFDFNFTQEVWNDGTKRKNGACALKKGEKYFVRDNETESHEINELMELVGVARLESNAPDDNGENYLLFKDGEGDFWIAKPVVKVSGLVELGGTNQFGLTIHFDGRRWGSRITTKEVLQEEIVAKLRLLNSHSN